MVRSLFYNIFHYKYVILPRYFKYEVTQFYILSSIPFLMRFVALHNKNLFLTHFFLRIMSHLFKMSTELPPTHQRLTKAKQKNIKFSSVCLSSFWIGCAKKGKKIYPLNLSILQQITVNGVNFCTAYVFGRLDDRSLVFSILWLSPKIIAFHPKETSFKMSTKKRKKHNFENLGL